MAGWLELIGAFFVLRHVVWPLVRGVYGSFVRPMPAVSKSFGPWAVVTGCTDGIGKAVAVELAQKHKMNLVLVSRTKSKLDALAAELSEVETKVVALDFNTAAKEDFVAPVVRACSGLEVGLVVNNAGASYEHADFFQHVDPARVSMLINLNVTALTKVTHALLPGMLARKKGAVVNISSGSSLVAEPMYAVYSATKAYVNNFSRALAVECAPHGVTVQAALPFFVTTKLSKLRHSNFFIANEASYAKALIRSLGQSGLVVNFWPHALQAAIIQWVPEPILTRYLVANGTSIRRRAYAKKKAAAGAGAGKTE